MKFLKFILLFVMLICFSLLFLGCNKAGGDDEKRIINWLDKTYGKNSYTIKKEEKNERYFVVKLSKYPKLEFRATVARDVKVGNSYIWTDFEEVFGKAAIKEFKKSQSIAKDKLEYSDSIGFVYSIDVKNLEELRISYNRLLQFLNFISENYKVLLVDENFDVRMDVRGIRLKGRDDGDKWIYLDIAKAEGGGFKIKPYEEIYAELNPMLMTHPENKNGLKFRADIGRLFILGSDTVEDCLYKNLILQNSKREDLEQIILQPGEISENYTLKSESDYEFTTVTVRAKNLSEAPAPLLDATIVEAVIDGGKSAFIDNVLIELENDPRRAWIDPYKALGILEPKTEKEKKEGVNYKNVKVLFVIQENFLQVKKIVLTLQG